MSGAFGPLADLPSAGAWIEELGLEIDEITGTKVLARLNLGQRHHTPWGVVHGGVYTTLIETVASLGASAAVLEREEFAVGVSNNTDFLRTATEGRVRVSAEAVIQGRVQGRVRLQNVPLRGFVESHGHKA